MNLNRTSFKKTEHNELESNKFKKTYNELESNKF